MSGCATYVRDSVVHTCPQHAAFLCCACVQQSGRQHAQAVAVKSLDKAKMKQMKVLANDCLLGCNRARHGSPFTHWKVPDTLVTSEVEFMRPAPTPPELGVKMHAFVIPRCTWCLP